MERVDPQGSTSSKSSGGGGGGGRSSSSSSSSSSTWTPAVDATLATLVATHGPKEWSMLAKELNRLLGCDGKFTSKKVRERFCYHLDPAINKSAFTPEEDLLIIEKRDEIGNRWVSGGGNA